MRPSRVVASTILIGALGCIFGPGGPPFTIETVGISFVGDVTSGEVNIPIIVRNNGDAAGRTRSCAASPGEIALNLSLERREDGQWVGRDDAFFACAPPTIGELVLRPGEEYADVLELRLDAREYRLRLFYHPVGDREGWRRTDPSDAFVVTLQ